ncbi:MAG: NAD(P)-dependent oxidoreductase [Opitutaceae bacterium]|nr:NAD(P)-dependent oxidoreductase [Opitutaceae bacterium]
MAAEDSSTYVIVGGHGYIGRSLAERLRREEPLSRVVLADRFEHRAASKLGVESVRWDVREPAPQALVSLRPDWIFNFAAIHREPGHDFEEYFDTNLPGARQVVALAEATGCQNLFFTSSIAIYGPTRGATDEETKKYPNTGYGISKYLAEQIHETWQAGDPSRRLVIVRPGVIYGPLELGNIRRMVQAIRKGIFIFPGNRSLKKSYGYIEGLLDSFQFTRERVGTPVHPDPVLIYNYVETPTEPLENLAAGIAAELGKKPRSFSVPLPLLALAARAIYVLKRGRTEIHPKRVYKAATPTEIIPQKLISMGFPFRYSFRDSLRDWKAKEPELWAKTR